MIVKYLSRRGPIRPLISYLCREGKEDDADEAKVILKHNVRSKDIDGWTSEFAAINARRLQRRSTNISIGHYILALHHDDKDRVDEKTLKALCRKFVSLRGMKSAYLVVMHTGKHPHAHICMSSVDTGGSGNRISRSAFAQLKENLQNFQLSRFPNLVSLPHHGKSKELKASEKEPPLPRWNGRSSQKEKLLNALKSTYSKAGSQKAFLAGLQAQGYEPYYRGTEKKLTGVMLESGLKFRFRPLGYASEKLAELDSLEKELSELRRIRNRPQAQERIRENNSRSSGGRDW